MYVRAHTWNVFTINLIENDATWLFLLTEGRPDWCHVLARASLLWRKLSGRVQAEKHDGVLQLFGRYLLSRYFARLRCSFPAKSKDQNFISLAEDSYPNCNVTGLLCLSNYNSMFTHISGCPFWWFLFRHTGVWKAGTGDWIFRKRSRH